ncbi:acid protease [Suillus decipiens]|nr:acid protease [Suillus decipiens]
MVPLTSCSTIKLVRRSLGDPSMRSHAGSTSVTNDGVGYIAAVDTGSSHNLVNTRVSVEVDYDSGYFTGIEHLDSVTLGSGLTITNQSTGIAYRSSGFGSGVDGILGIGPVDLTKGTLTNSSTQTMTITTVTDDLYKQGTISQDVVSAFFEPSSLQTETKGELTFGGTDATKYTGDIAYTPITTTNPASTFWGSNESIAYDSMTTLSSIAVSSILAPPLFQSRLYQSATGAASDKVNSLLTVSSARYNTLKNLDFYIGKETYTLIPNAQIWPRSLNSHIHGSSDAIYLVFNDLGTPSGKGSDFINGYTFLRRFYSVFDTANSRIGFAQTSFTNATTN